MMIDVTVANVDLDLTALYTHMNPLVADADVTGHTRSRITFTAANGDRYVVTGTDLHWGKGGLKGGAVDALTYHSDGQPVISFANLQTNAGRLWAAMQAEKDGTNPTALTHLLVHHCWTYHGSQGVDYFPETSISPFGLLNPTGNDKIFLNGGDDVFFTGAAKDTVLGGDGNDTISGGTENDLLYGGSGHDALYGGTEDDRLDGGLGADSLTGGDGVDILTGGLSADRMKGGEGADVFVFAGFSGHDTIVDYTPGIDHLQITSVGPVTMADHGKDSMIHFGHNTILLLGVTLAELSADDFL